MLSLKVVGRMNQSRLHGVEFAGSPLLWPLAGVMLVTGELVAIRPVGRIRSVRSAHCSLGGGW